MSECLTRRKSGSFARRTNEFDFIERYVTCKRGRALTVNKKARVLHANYLCVSCGVM